MHHTNRHWNIETFRHHWYYLCHRHQTVLSPFSTVCWLFIDYTKPWLTTICHCRYSSFTLCHFTELRTELAYPDITQSLYQNRFRLGLRLFTCIHPTYHVYNHYKDGPCGSTLSYQTAISNSQRNHSRGATHLGNGVSPVLQTQEDTSGWKSRYGSVGYAGTDDPRMVSERPRPHG
jgi:hypothetical protein